MTVQRTTSLLLLAFMGLFGVLETTVSALAPRLGGETGTAVCPPEMMMCPMHAGEPCCCGMTGESDPAAGPVTQFGEGCLGAPEAPPVTYPVTPLFRFLLPETATLEQPFETVPFLSSADGHALPAFDDPPTPPPQFL